MMGTMNANLALLRKQQSEMRKAFDDVPGELNRLNFTIRENMADRQVEAVRAAREEQRREKIRVDQQARKAIAAAERKAHEHRVHQVEWSIQIVSMIVIILALCTIYRALGIAGYCNELLVHGLTIATTAVGCVWIGLLTAKIRSK